MRFPQMFSIKLIAIMPSSTALSSITLTLTGNSSNLTAQYFPPIELDSHSNYVCGLIDFQTYNSIPNINETNNRIYYSEVCQFYLKPGKYNLHEIQRNASLQNPQRSSSYFEKFKEHFNRSLLKADDGLYTITVRTTFGFHGFDFVTIPTGSYEFDEIAAAFQEKFASIGISLKISSNKNTLKSELTSDRSIDLSKAHSVGATLGFKSQVLEPNVTHTSDSVIKITSVNTIRIDCNIANGAYLNNMPTHTIHSFYPSVQTGYKIVEVPRNIIYFPVFAGNISQLDVKVTNQENNLIDFRGEVITLRIHIKRVKI